MHSLYDTWNKRWTQGYTGNLYTDIYKMWVATCSGSEAEAALRHRRHPSLVSIRLTPYIVSSFDLSIPEIMVRRPKVFFLLRMPIPINRNWSTSTRVDPTVLMQTFLLTWNEQSKPIRIEWLRRCSKLTSRPFKSLRTVDWGGTCAVQTIL